MESEMETQEDIQEELQHMMTPLPEFTNEDEKETFISEVESSGNIVVYNEKDEPIGFIVTKDYND